MADKAGVVYITAVPQVSIGELLGKRADGTPVIFIEDEDGEHNTNGPYQIVMTVTSAKFLVCSLVDAIDEQQRRNPELADEMDCEGYDVECIEDFDDEGEEDGEL